MSLFATRYFRVIFIYRGDTFKTQVYDIGPSTRVGKHFQGFLAGVVTAGSPNPNPISNQATNVNYPFQTWSLKVVLAYIFIIFNVKIIVPKSHARVTEEELHVTKRLREYLSVIKPRFTQDFLHLSKNKEDCKPSLSLNEYVPKNTQNSLAALFTVIYKLRELLSQWTKLFSVTIQMKPL